MSDRTSRRRVLQLGSVSLASAVGGCTSVLYDVSASDDGSSNGESGNPAETSVRNASDEVDEDDEADDPPSVDDPPVSLSDTPIPSDAESHRYATMGTGADVTATVFGNWKCPYTREFAFGLLPELVSEFVEPGDVDIAFRALAYRDGDPLLGADAPRAARAGLAVWDVDPEAYWSYFGYAFANQSSTDERWATPELLTRCAAEAGVSDPDAVETRIRTDAYEDATTDTVAAARDRGVHSVPRLVVDGDVVAPTVDRDAAVEALEAATRS